MLERTCPEGGLKNEFSFITNPIQPSSMLVVCEHKTSAALTAILPSFSSCGAAINKLSPVLLDRS
jgi:hypothetical protein